MKKPKPTARHPTSDYPTITCTTHGNDAATTSSSTDEAVEDRFHASETPLKMFFAPQRKALEFSMHHPSQSNQSTSSFCRLRTTKKRINVTKASFDNQRRKESVGWVKSPQGQPPVLYPIKARMGPPELRFYPRTTRSQRRRSTPYKIVGWVQPPQGQPPILYPIKARMGPPEGGSTPELLKGEILLTRWAVGSNHLRANPWSYTQ